MNTHSNAHNVINKWLHPGWGLITERKRCAVWRSNQLLIKPPCFLSDDPILNNNQRQSREEGGEGRGGSRRLDMQLCESCSGEDKPWLPNWNHLVGFNLFFISRPHCCTCCTKLCTYRLHFCFITQFKCQREMSTSWDKKQRFPILIDSGVWHLCPHNGGCCRQARPLWLVSVWSERAGFTLTPLQLHISAYVNTHGCNS